MQINRESIDLRYVEQITDSEQVTALGYCMRYAQKYLFDGKRTMGSSSRIGEKIQKDALAGLCGNSSSITGMAMPRAQEIFACFNRYRGLKV